MLNIFHGWITSWTYHQHPKRFPSIRIVYIVVATNQGSYWTVDINGTRLLSHTRPYHEAFEICELKTLVSVEYTRKNQFHLVAMETRVTC
jgi:hypothetical protein